MQEEELEDEIVETTDKSDRPADQFVSDGKINVLPFQNSATHSYEVNLALSLMLSLGFVRIFMLQMFTFS